MNMEEITDKLVNSVVEAMGQSGYVQVEVSARHVHLSQNDLEALFGAGAKLVPKRPLSQPGQFLSEQRVTLIGEKGRKENVAVLGPVRKDTQIELSRSDAVSLGVTAPLRESGNIEGSGAVKIQGPKGSVHVRQGAIVAHNHIHMTPEDAKGLGLEDKQHVAVELSGERPIVFKDVIVRVSREFRLRMHIDFDEANAGDIGKLAFGKIISANGRGDSASLMPQAPPACDSSRPSGTPNRPALLLLPQGNQPPGMPKPEESGLDKELLEREFDLLCAKKIAYHPDWNQIEGVVAFGLTIEAMGKIAAGVVDDCYTRAMSQAILRGKPVYILRSQVELFQYEKSAPGAYYKKLQEHLTLLERSGLTVLNRGLLEAFILRQKTGKAPEEDRPPQAPAQDTDGEPCIIAKHLVAERDIAEAKNAGMKQVTITAKAILTDLARDFARNHNITIIRG